MHENEHILNRNKDLFNNQDKIIKTENKDIVFDKNSMLNNVSQYTLL